MDNVKKHYDKLHKQIDLRLGKGKADEILHGLDYVTGDESANEIRKWATEITERLENSIPEEDLIPIREECACIKANKYSTYNKKYFKEIREQHPDNDEDCHMDIVETFATGGSDCIFSVWYTEKYFQ
ncbi:hypothetical protein [Anaerosporobacter sp.]|uniref:hypothetical protein n=1 Tax=Anaerosporobacter sp. TaxID=1872529 RepID=UPI00286F20E6|nr:hypothetical protein [Anaerosporobacter sp.]